MPSSTDSSSASAGETPLGRALLAYGEARRGAVAEARRELSLNELDARALLFVVDNPGARPSDVRDHLGITSAGVTTLIDRLVQRGAVRRDLDTEDRRVNHITAVIDLGEHPWSLLRAFDRSVDEAIRDLDPAESERLARIIEHVVAAASRAD